MFRKNKKSGTLKSKKSRKTSKKSSSRINSIKNIPKKRKRKKPESRILTESEQIVEFSYNPEQKQIVTRFLNGESYILNISDLPKSMQSNKPIWEQMQLFIDRSRILVQANSRIREIPSNLIRKRGHLIS